MRRNCSSVAIKNTAQSDIISGSLLGAWLLACLTPLGWLNRMTHFKEKAGKNREMAGLGLYAYPVLMAVSSVISDRDNSSQAVTMVNGAI